MARYDFSCPGCGARFEVERPFVALNQPAPCPVCENPGIRQFTIPRLLFKADPRDVRPVWHKHDGYAHSHAPGRGRHKLAGEDH